MFRSIATLLIFLSPSFAIGQGEIMFGAERDTWPQTEFRKSKNGFAGWIVVTSDEDWIEKWNTPPETVVFFNSVDTLRIGESATTLILMANPKVDDNGNVNVTCDIKITRPDNTVSVELKAAQCLRGALVGDPNLLRLSPVTMKFVGEPNDPLGVWRTELGITDVNRETRLDLAISIDLQSAD
jgi:hypothetical protein